MMLPTTISDDDRTESDSRPAICSFDLLESDIQALSSAGYKPCEHSLGGRIKVPNTERGSRYLLRSNHDIPSHLHEYDILIVDLSPREPEPFKQSDMTFEHVGAHKTFAFLSSYPQNVFDCKPLGVHLLGLYLQEFLAKESILIVFPAGSRDFEYELVEIGPSGNTVCERPNHSTLLQYNGIPNSRNKSGSRVRLPEKENSIAELLLKYMSGGRYSLVFNTPMSWVEGQNKPRENFIPLLENEAGEIVAFIDLQSKGMVIYLPQIEKKGEFLGELFNQHFAGRLPNIFPQAGYFSWLDDASYPLPGELQLRHDREALERKYAQDLESNKQALLTLKENYAFLRKLLSATGEELVCAVAEFLRWIEFENVINMDEHAEDTLEEDIQVDCGDRLLVVEVKGIGGTSTDKACSQISKIRYRRAEQRGRFDVHGLYVVNHQRYVSPRQRKNPPFTTHQINDAKLDKRGLMTTYDMYIAYLNVLGGVLDKANIRDRLFDVGLIDCYAGLFFSLGTPTELLKQKTVVILELSGHKLAVGDNLFSKDQDNLYSIHEIKSIQLNDVTVDVAARGEVGLLVSPPLTKKSEIFVRA